MAERPPPWAVSIDAPEAGVSKQQRVYEAVRERIVDGRYGPGYRLVFSVLAREFGVSALPVREAIRRLEAEGWIRHTRNVGASVEEMNLHLVDEGLHTLALLEGYATALAGPLLEPEDLAELHRLNEEMRALLPAVDPLAFSRLNRSFHFAIVSRCPNEHVRELTTQAWERLDAMRRSLFVHLPARSSSSVAEHDELLALLEEGAAAAELERLARDHKLRLIDALRVAASRRVAAQPENRAMERR